MKNYERVICLDLKSDLSKGRPEFPKRAVITAGMPYGNKELHFGHIGGFLFMPMFLHVF